MLVCCGGFAYLGWTVKDSFTNDPVKIREKAATIVDIDVPPELEPKIAGNLLVMQMVGYGSKGSGDKAMLFLIQIPKSMVSGRDDAREQMQKQLEQQHSQRRGAKRLQGATPSSRETRVFKIRGEDITFQIVKYDGSNGNPKSVEVVGLFESKGGYCMLQLDADEDALTQEQIETMLQSIK